MARHITWRCDCGAVTYGAPLFDGCSLLDGQRASASYLPGLQRAPTPVDSPLIDFPSTPAPDRAERTAKRQHSNFASAVRWDRHVLLGSVTTPGQHSEVVQRLLNAYPGASYLRTDESCPSLGQATADGNPIRCVSGGWQIGLCGMRRGVCRGWEGLRQMARHHPCPGLHHPLLGSPGVVFGSVVLLARYSGAIIKDRAFVS